jgi:hypothetical protein
MSRLKADSSSDVADREAKELRPVILEIEGLAISRPLVADRFEILTRLYTVLAVRLANGKKCAEALEAVEKASVISPENDEVKSLKKQLTEIMESIQKRVGEFWRFLSSNPRAQLTAEGVSMKEQARLGLELAKKFRLSERATQANGGYFALSGNYSQLKKGLFGNKVSFSRSGARSGGQRSESQALLARSGLTGRSVQCADRGRSSRLRPSADRIKRTEELFGNPIPLERTCRQRPKTRQHRPGKGYSLSGSSLSRCSVASG